MYRSTSGARREHVVVVNASAGSGSGSGSVQVQTYPPSLSFTHFSIPARGRILVRISAVLWLPLTLLIFRIPSFKFLLIKWYRGAMNRMFLVSWRQHSIAALLSVSMITGSVTGEHLIHWIMEFRKIASSDAIDMARYSTSAIDVACLLSFVDLLLMMKFPNLMIKPYDDWPLLLSLKLASEVQVISHGFVVSSTEC